MPAPVPLFVGVEAAAQALGISRGLAYELCREYLAGRRDGIPCRRFGPRRILVPRAALQRLADPTWDEHERSAS